MNRYIPLLLLVLLVLETHWLLTGPKIINRNENKIPTVTVQIEIKLFKINYSLHVIVIELSLPLIVLYDMDKIMSELFFT